MSSISFQWHGTELSFTILPTSNSMQQCNKAQQHRTTTPRHPDTATPRQTHREFFFVMVDSTLNLRVGATTNTTWEVERGRLCKHSMTCRQTDAVSSFQFHIKIHQLNNHSTTQQPLSNHSATTQPLNNQPLNHSNLSSTDQ